tara:strand:+ start:505 stop:1197 length:693 start_codon:yes stop_codon:yes gene_type:complete
MDSLEKYFTKEEAEILPDCTIYKKINNKTNPFIESDENGEYDLSRKHLKIQSGHRAPWSNNSIEWDEKEFFSNFVSLNKNDLTVPNLKQLEGKFILLEWNGGDFWGKSQITNCSFISFMRVYKPTDRDKEYEEWYDEGIYVCEARRKYSDLPMMFYKVSNDLYEYLTTSNFELQNYSFTDGYRDTTTWSYKWKIWIPTDCYKRYFGSTYYKMCLLRVFDRDIAYKICSFI